MWPQWPILLIIRVFDLCWLNLFKKKKKLGGGKEKWQGNGDLGGDRWG